MRKARNNALRQEIELHEDLSELDREIRDGRIIKDNYEKLVTKVTQSGKYEILPEDLESITFKEKFEIKKSDIMGEKNSSRLLRRLNT